RRQRDPRLRRGPALGRDRATGLEHFGVDIDAATRGFQRRRINVIEHHVIAMPRALEPDLLAHRPRADDRDATHVPQLHHQRRIIPVPDGGSAKAGRETSIYGAFYDQAHRRRTATCDAATTTPPGLTGANGTRRGSRSRTAPAPPRRRSDRPCRPC